MNVKRTILCVIVLVLTALLIIGTTGNTKLRKLGLVIAVTLDEEYSIEFLTPETVKVTGYEYRAMEELREKYVIKNIQPIYGNPKKRFAATEYIVTVEPKSSQ